MLRVFVAALVSLPGSLVAACFGDVGTPLMHCGIEGGKTELRVCLQGDTGYYAYGPRGGAPDIVIARHVSNIEMTPWPGIGRSYWQEMTFSNGSYQYRLNHNFDRFEELPPSGQLTVLRDGKEIAQLFCDRADLRVADFDPLLAAKEAAGACFEPGAGWRSCP